jgi:hypothetical protein
MVIPAQVVIHMSIRMNLMMVGWSPVELAGYACHGGNSSHRDECNLTVCGDGYVEGAASWRRPFVTLQLWPRLSGRISGKMGRSFLEFSIDVFHYYPLVN